MWRHLSMVVVALKTVVQRVRSNRWRFDFERARTGGQINFPWKTAMIITITKTSILIICPVPRGLLLTYPISPPPNTRSPPQARVIKLRIALVLVEWSHAGGGETNIDLGQCWLLAAWLACILPMRTHQELYLVSFTNPLASRSGLVERTPKNGLIWLWSLILQKNWLFFSGEARDILLR